VKLSGPFAAPPPRKPPKVKRDTDEERAEKNYVRARDRFCVAPSLPMPATGIAIRHASPCDGPLDVDHVRPSGGLGMKSETHRRNMVVLCRHHHRAKTEYGKTWRPLLLAYLARVEG
jgi:5-methylcytosine-specific restriction endonuclease McrA